MGFWIFTPLAYLNASGIGVAAVLKRGTNARGSGCMALIVNIFISHPPGLHVFGNNGLSASIIDMHVPHRLFARLVQPRQRFQCRSTSRLSLKSKAHVAVGGIWKLAHVVS